MMKELDIRGTALWNVKPEQARQQPASHSRRRGGGCVAAGRSAGKCRWPRLRPPMRRFCSRAPTARSCWCRSAAAVGVRLVIVSEAKQSSPSLEPLDCFVAEPVIGPARGRTRWLLAMTVSSRSSRRRRPNAGRRLPASRRIGRPARNSQRLKVPCGRSVMAMRVALFLAGAARHRLRPGSPISMRSRWAIPAAVEMARRTLDYPAAEIVDEAVFDLLAVKPAIAAHPPVLGLGLDVEENHLDGAAGGRERQKVVHQPAGALGAVDGGEDTQHRERAPEPDFWYRDGTGGVTATLMSSLLFIRAGVETPRRRPGSVDLPRPPVPPD